MCIDLRCKAGRESVGEIVPTAWRDARTEVRRLSDWYSGSRSNPITHPLGEGDRTTSRATGGFSSNQSVGVAR